MLIYPTSISEHTGRLYLPSSLAVKLGPCDCLLNNGMWTEEKYTILRTDHKTPWLITLSASLRWWWWKTHVENGYIIIFKELGSIKTLKPQLQIVPAGSQLKSIHSWLTKTKRHHPLMSKIPLQPLGRPKPSEIPWSIEQFLFIFGSQELMPSFLKGSHNSVHGWEKSEEQVSHHKLSQSETDSFQRLLIYFWNSLIFICTEQAHTAVQTGRQNPDSLV